VNSSKRVVVTGLGVITSIGENISDFKEGLFSGRSGIGPISVFDTEGYGCRSAGEVKRRDLKSGFEPRDVRRMSRCDLLGLIAAREACADADLENYDGARDRVGVVLGGGAGGMLSWERHRRAVWSQERRTRPSQLLASAPCTLTDLIAGRYALYGLRSTICTACSSSATSIGYGYDLIRSGDHDIVLTGGSEALSELTFAGFNSLKLAAPEYCRPFDKKRRGLSLGEGAAILVLEDFEHASARGACVYAEVLGYAINADAVHITSPDSGGMGRVMARALLNTGLAIDEVDYINAHGTATRINDKMETIAIKDVFGHRAGMIPVSSTKSMVGHCLGAAGAVEGVATVLSICEQAVPPTIHLEEPDPECDLDYVPGHARKREIRSAMSNSFAFGGNNTSVVFARADC
jgi:3-oxoacyl-[acyl-carrier-protein] synthase II